MKIMFICDTMGSGGAERVIATLSNYFSKLGHQIEILMLSSNSGDSFYELEENITLTKLSNDDCKFLKKAKLLKKYIVSKKPNVVISFLSYVCIYTWWALRRTKIPYIVSERNDPNQRSKIKQCLLNLSFKKSVGCVFQTNDALNWYKKRVKTKSVVIHNPVDLSFEPQHFRSRKKQVLYIGRFTDQKNLFMLIDAFKLFSLKHKNYVLKMYGNGELKEEIVKYISDKNLVNKVVISPSSSKWQKEESDSQLFVLPSKYEGMPNGLAEALCLGIPSVSTNCTIGGPKELKTIFPKQLILSDDMSAESFYNAMEEGLLINDFEPKIPIELSAETIVDQWVSFINQVVKED